jgi:hypothetical protein
VPLLSATTGHRSPCLNISTSHVGGRGRKPNKPPCPSSYDASEPQKGGRRVANIRWHSQQHISHTGYPDGSWRLGGRLYMTAGSSARAERGTSTKPPHARPPTSSQSFLMSIISLVAQCQSAVLLSTSAPKMTRSLRTVPFLWAGEPIADAAHRRGPTRAKSLVLKKRFMGALEKEQVCRINSKRTSATCGLGPCLPFSRASTGRGASIKIGTSIGPRPRTEQEALESEAGATDGLSPSQR